MHIFPGCNALSDFRKNKLLSIARTIHDDIAGISARFIHFATFAGNLDSKEKQKLENLLDYGPGINPPETDALTLLVVPRPGTISPWASKAADIIRNCGLTRLIRIERGIQWQFSFHGIPPDIDTLQSGIREIIHDRMTQVVLLSTDDANLLFRRHPAKQLAHIDIQQHGHKALVEANSDLGLALSDDEIDYLLDAFTGMQRNPTDVELMMFAQANSEHCRHKIFNAEWKVDGNNKEQSLFAMIRTTFQENPGRIKSAYKDNAAVMSGYAATRFFATPADGQYSYHNEDVNILMKVETHNHPTAISPYAGAATGTGGEIRDETATGTGAKPKAGLTGFTVSNLHLPDLPQPWEEQNGKPARIVSALDIMLDGPIGAAAFNNEFGRPALCGYFRTYEQTDTVAGITRGYHKPIMLAGGYGVVRSTHILKQEIPSGAKIIVLGGPAMLIGLGGGAASSMASGESAEDLDYASVQRDNPEMQRRCQEVIDQCWAMGADNPIISIHDVGAGGLANALPELVHDSGRGAVFELRNIPNDDAGMSPMEIWCNEAQERYVLAVNAGAIDLFARLCKREHAPFAILGEATTDCQLVLHDNLFDNNPIDMPLQTLLGKPPRMLRTATHTQATIPPLSLQGINIDTAIERILQLPAVADKRFLITIGDRSVSGLVVRDQMVGPWQTPVADCTVTASSFDAWVGEAMATGERSPVAVINPPASGRLALAEAITNICAARILNLQDIALSANWMAACGLPEEDVALYDTVKAVTDLARNLGIAIPVGKDSLSMNTIWHNGNREQQVRAPLSLNITAFAAVADIRQSLTPCLQPGQKETCLVLVDLSAGKNRLGGSALAQAFNRPGGQTADLDAPGLLQSLFQVIQLLNEQELLLAYHDRSDGGLFTTLCEMAFCSRTGIDILLDTPADNLLPALFSEEPGAVIQVATENLDMVLQTFTTSGLDNEYLAVIGMLNETMKLRIVNAGTEIFSSGVLQLHRSWSLTTFHMQSLRDNPACALQEYDRLLDAGDPGLFLSVPETLHEQPEFAMINTSVRPAVAVLREQGINGHVEMAAAFDRAGFISRDVHMNDILYGRTSLKEFTGIAACGGFSYGDVLGAGGGWAKTILFNQQLRDEFQAFFEREDTFGLGVCNGCQMMSRLKALIPGTRHWPVFEQNTSARFESRLVMVAITASPSILLQGMEGSKLPLIVAHGEGRAVFTHDADLEKSNPVMLYLDNYGEPAGTYPANPNGSPGGLTGFTSDDGRFTIMMPHPERVFLSRQYSWIPPEWTSETGPWMQLFRNARIWTG
jgi:phosphoribosylformylglycinamidine synthase